MKDRISPENLIDSLDNLRFANGVRLHWNTPRQQHWLLFPEGALRLNQTAVAVLSLCNGDRQLEEIIATLSKQYRHVDSEMVRDLLSQMMQRGLLIKKTQ